MTRPRLHLAPPDSLNRLAKRIFALERKVHVLSTQPQLGSSGFNGTIVQYDENGNVVAGYGTQPDGTNGVVTYTGPTPPTPSAPLLTPITGGLRVVWDGTFTDALVAPLDFSRVSIYVYANPGFDPTSAELVGSIESPQGGAAIVIPLAPIPQYVKFICWSTAGKPSAPSAESVETPGAEWFPAKDSWVISDTFRRAYRLSSLPVDQSVNLSLNGLELEEGPEYVVDLGTGDVTLDASVDTVAGADPDILTADYWTTGVVTDPAPATGMLVLPLHRAMFNYGPYGWDDVVVGGVVVTSPITFTGLEAVADNDDTNYVWFQQATSGARQNHLFYLDNPPIAGYDFPLDADFIASRLRVRYKSNMDVSLQLVLGWENPQGTDWYTTPVFIDLPAASVFTEAVFDIPGHGGPTDNAPFTVNGLEVTYPTGWSSPYPNDYVGGAISLELVCNDTYNGGGPLALAPALPTGADVKISALAVELGWVDTTPEDYLYNYEFGATSSALPSGWDWVRQSSGGSYDEANGVGTVIDSAGDAGNPNWNAIAATLFGLETGDYTVVAELSASGTPAQFGLRCSADNKAIVVAVNGSACSYAQWPHIETAGTYPDFGPSSGPTATTIWRFIKIVRHDISGVGDTNHYDLYVSEDGATWDAIVTSWTPASGYGSSVMDQLVFGVDKESSGAASASISLARIFSGVV